MNTIVVCYSLEGHARTVSEEAARRLDAQLVELRCVKPYATSGPGKFLRSSKDTLAGAKPELEPVNVDLAHCDLLILAAPCWAGRPAAPINTFLARPDVASSAARRAGIITFKAQNAQDRYAEAARKAYGLAEGAPVCAVSEAQIADAAELGRALDAFCEACRAKAGE